MKVEHGHGWGRRVAALVTAGGLILAACGSDEETGSGAGDEGGTGDTVDLALLWEVKGESEVAIDDYDNGAALAIEEINAAGGIDGRQIETTRIAASPLDPQQSVAAYLEALDSSPDAIVGFAAPDQLIAAIGNVDRGGVPLIPLTAGEDALRFGAEAGSEWTWPINESSGSIVDSTVRYMTDELGLSKIGLLGTSNTFGTDYVAFAKKVLAERGLEPVVEETYEPTATDLTQQVLAVKSAGADGVVNGAYPNPLAVQLKQFLQNGLSIPTFSGGATPPVVNNGLATGEAIDNLYAVLPCNPPGTDRTALAEFAERYEERFPDAALPGNLAALAYDAVYVLKAAIEEAGTTDHDAVNEAMGQIRVTDGVVCAAEYQADDAHFLHHESVVVAYAPDGTSETVATYETPMLDEGGG